ncbi:MAG TPA: HDOD domain-containing protein, partial [Rhodocyclaceae bacterium]|nr:HDOD domain-containing protein [Rhodocyclaceae bacterium]
IDALREDLDKVSARDLSHAILQDPLMSVRTLAYIQPIRGRHLQHDITTIASAIMMSGIEPFFNRFVELPTVENMLKDEPAQAKLGVMQVIRRAQRAAEYANEWAFWRHDINAEEVRLAALLHDLSEILVWCFAPKLALQIRELRVQSPTMRSAAAQQQVLGFTLLELQQALCRVWHLPELLKQLMDDEHADSPRAKNVTLAVRLARHSANGWDDPALPDDYTDIGQLLNLSPDVVMHKVGAPVPNAASAEDQA